MKRPTNFTLTKVKLMNGGGIEINYREKKEDKGITDTIDWSTKNSIDPHPDLIDKVNELKQYLSKCYNMDALLVLSKSKGLDKKNKAAFKIVSDVVWNVYEENMKKIAITGVNITGEVDGDKDKRSVIITGTMLQENNSKTALNSPRIKLNNDKFKFESDVQDIINDLDEEVMAYLFEGKRAQLDMFKEQETAKLPQDFVDGKAGKAKEKKAVAA